MPYFPYTEDIVTFTNWNGLDANNPADHSLLTSSLMRDNFRSIASHLLDLKHRAFSNGAVGQIRTETDSRSDYILASLDCYPSPVTPDQTALNLLGVPVISCWITPTVSTNLILLNASIFGYFPEGILFHVTRANYAYNALPGDKMYLRDAAYLSALQAVHPRFSHVAWGNLPHVEALASSAPVTPTQGQTVSFQVIDPAGTPGTGWCYTVWLKPMPGMPSSTPFRFNATWPPTPSIPQYGITTLSLTEIWERNPK